MKIRRDYFLKSSRTSVATVIGSILFSLLPVVCWAQLSPLVFKPPPESLTVYPSAIPSAFTLLGVNAESIKRPGTMNELVATIRTATNDFTELPSDLAIEIYPYWMRKGRTISFDEYTDSSMSASLKQTFSLSLATSFGEKSTPDSSAVAAAVGADVSFSRGKVDPEFENYQSKLELLDSLLAHHNREWGNTVESLLKANDRYMELNDSLKKVSFGSTEWSNINEEMKAIKAEVTQRLEDSLEVVESERLEEIEGIASSIYLRRIGFKWDLAGGLATISPQGGWKDIGFKGGAWTTLGYEWKNWGGMIVARALLERFDSTEVSIDVGFKAFFDKPRKPLSFSGELLYHRLLSQERDDDRLRAVLIADYRLGNFAVISLATGNEFGPDIGKPIAYFKILLGNDLKIPFPTLESKND
ncbi:MAG: hypothetical protein E3J71_05385 [Candidatus Stahlbacteria bacterium]|nr:MAG: hypothetical protein E3J71_05385 [Candidatus Stahlbacteria bacterium]